MGVFRLKTSSMFADAAAIDPLIINILILNIRNEILILADLIVCLVL